VQKELAETLEGLNFELLDTSYKIPITIVVAQDLESTSFFAKTTLFFSSNFFANFFLVFSCT